VHNQTKKTKIIFGVHNTWNNSMLCQAVIKLNSRMIFYLLVETQRKDSTWQSLPTWVTSVCRDQLWEQQEFKQFLFTLFLHMTKLIPFSENLNSTHATDFIYTDKHSLDFKAECSWIRCDDWNWHQQWWF